MLEKIREWLRRVLRALFSPDVYDQVVRSAQGEEEENPGGTAQLKGTEYSSGNIGSGNNKIERRHILFYGRVQGVGFRYHAMNAARYHSLTGWVKNLYDGSVEMEVQGPASSIDRMIVDITSNGRWIMIERLETEIIPVVKGDRSFQVRGY